VASINQSGTTGLTEAQARALADWWGGSFQELSSPGGAGKARYAVICEVPDQDPPAPPHPRAVVVWSLEGAQALEKLRDAVNPCAPDWVG
jgi:hypothetical protein